jgi:hypothetical protein
MDMEAHSFIYYGEHVYCSSNNILFTVQIGEKTMYRKCRRCKQHISVFDDDVCLGCREEERQWNLGE